MLEKKRRNWIWERNSTNWLAGWLDGRLVEGLAGRVSRWLAVCHPRWLAGWLAGREIGS